MDIKGSALVNQLKNLLPGRSATAGSKKVEQYSGHAMSALFSEFKLFSVEQANDNFATQSGLAHLINSRDFDLSSLQHEGRSILDLSPEEAADLIGEEGFYGIKNTAQRLSGFVINGGGDDLEKVKAGREGIARGFKEAEKLWGGTLPDISYKTLERALQQIDARIQELGGSVINAEV